MNSRIISLKVEEKCLRSEMDQCTSIYKYIELKKKLESVQETIAIESGTFATFSAKRIIRIRIDELESKVAKKKIEKSKCKDIGIYRTIVDNIELLERSIDENRVLLAKLGGL